MVNKVTTVFENDTTGAVRSNEELAKSLDGTESKAKLVAQALHAQAAGIEADFKASVEASDALAKALGPEMAARVGQNGIDKFVADLKGAGLTAHDIKADVTDLAGALQHLDDVGKSISGPKQGLEDVAGAADHAKTKIHDVGHEGDNSRSVLANMVGNSTQDLAGLGGVAGTAGMALGQMGEYATEGNISLQGLAKVAGPMAAVTVVALGISHVLGQIAKEKAFDRARVDEFTKALHEGKTAAEAWDAALSDKKKVEFIDAATGDVADLTRSLADNNITWAEFKSHLDAGKESFDAWSLGLSGSTAHSDDANHLWQAGNQLLNEQAKAVQEVADKHKVFGESADEAAARAKAATQTYQDQVTTTSDEVQRKVDEMSAKWDELNGKINAEKSMIQYKQQVDDVKAAVLAVGTAEAEHGVGSPEALAAKEAARLKTLDLESTTADLGSTILGLPAEQVTDLIARIDRGELDNMPGIIQSTLDSHTYRIKAHLDSIVIDGETHAAGSTSLTVNGKSNVIRAAAGGYFPARPGGYDVNLAEGGKGEYVIPEDQMGGGGVTVNLFVSGHVMAERDLVRAVADGIIDGQRRGEITAGFLVSP